METLSARVPDDVAEQVEQYAAERGISTSEAVRRLLVDGLEQDDVQSRLDRLEYRVDRLERRPMWWPW